jgi:hypothetical protein
MIMARQTHPHRPTHGFNKDDSQAAKDRIERESEVPSIVFKGSAKLKQERRAGEGSYARKQRQG